MSRSSGRRRQLMTCALLSVVALAGCQGTYDDPTPVPTRSPTVDASSALSRIDCTTGLTDGNARGAEMLVLHDGVLVPGEGPAEPLPAFGAEEVDRAPLDDSVVPVAAAQCAAVYVAGEGYAGFARRAYVGDLDALTATLRTAWLVAPSERACTDIIDSPPNVWVVTQDGGLVAPDWPADGCGHYTHPTPESLLNERTLSPVDLAALAPFP